MTGLNDLLLPVVDVNEEVWTSFFCLQELGVLTSLVSDLQQPMLGMGAILPMDLEERLLTALKIVTDSEDVSF